MVEKQGLYKNHWGLNHNQSIVQVLFQMVPKIDEFPATAIGDKTTIRMLFTKSLSQFIVQLETDFVQRDNISTWVKEPSLSKHWIIW